MGLNVKIKYISILASIATVGVITTPYIYSKLNNIPTISYSSINYENPKSPEVNLRWAVEIPKEDVFWDTGFEAIDHQNIDFVYDPKNGMGDGGQKFDNKSYSGEYAYYSPVTYPDKGNWVIYPYNKTAVKNHTQFKNKELIANNGDRITISYKLKTTDDSNIRVMGQWVFENKLYNTGVTVVGDYPKGAKVIRVTDARKFSSNSLEKGYLTFSNDLSVNSEHNRVVNVNRETNEITISPGLRESISSGKEINFKRGVWMFGDNDEYSNTKGKWELINFNTTITDNPYIEWRNHPTELRLGVISKGETWIDDLKVGFSTKSRLYKDGEVIYEGYDSQLKDISKDVTPPENVSDIDYNLKFIDKENITTVSFNVNSNDLGSNYTYEVSSINKDGAESVRSNPMTVNVKSGINGYSYVIDNNKLTNPDNTIDTYDKNFTYKIPDRNNQYYLHIKAIDKSGNIGNTTHLKIEEPVLSVKYDTNNNHMVLNWIFEEDSQNYTYEIYRKGSNESEYKLIDSVQNRKQFNDIAGMDLSKPSIPTIENLTFDFSRNKMVFDILSPADSGTLYSYYIKAINMENNSQVSSNHVNSEAKSELKGYSYTVDENMNTIPDNNIDINLNSSRVEHYMKKWGAKNYLHIKAIDNNGNVSETLHYSIEDTVNPTLNLELSNTGFSNNEVLLKAVSSDNLGVDFIIMPNSQKVYSDIAQYSVCNNGIYEFIVYDKFGNRIKKSIEVYNIDKTPPQLNISKNPDNEWSKEDVSIEINNRD